MNLAGALIFGGNYLLGTSLNLQRGYFRYKDLAKILGRNTSTLSIYHNRYILPLLKSKAFQRKYKQWED